MSNDHKRKLAEFVEDVTTPDVPWANVATAFVAMKKRAAAEVQHVEVGLSDRAVGLMAHMVAEKFALQAEATNCGWDKLASDEREHARFFLRKLASARGTSWLLPEVSTNTKLAAMKERSITIMQHLCDELGDDPMRFTVGGFIDQDVGSLGKLASLEQVKEKRAAGAAVALVRVKQPGEGGRASVPPACDLSWERRGGQEGAGRSAQAAWPQAGGSRLPRRLHQEAQ